MDLNILELFSGIGGMHYAFKYSKLPGKVVAAVDINTVANDVYAFNHRETCLMNNNVQKLSAKILERLQVDTILMSPPCQPHTRVGRKLDIVDERSDGLKHICNLLPQCKGVNYILMENVQGFEESLARNAYVEALEKSNFYFREFILSPSQIGIPNTRHRYYCLARRNKDFLFGAGELWRGIHFIKDKIIEKSLLSLLVEENIATEFYIDEKVLKRRVWVMDIVTGTSPNTMCFTKAYTHFSEGTGSVYCPLPLEEIKMKFAQLKEIENVESKIDNKEETRLILLRSLKLRYFTPREVARLMCFPETFDFPPEVTNRQKYRLLGNSINVCIVGELIKLMCS